MILAARNPVHTEVLIGSVGLNVPVPRETSMASRAALSSFRALPPRSSPAQVQGQSHPHGEALPCGLKSQERGQKQTKLRSGVTENICPLCGVEVPI